MPGPGPAPNHVIPLPTLEDRVRTFENGVRTTIKRGGNQTGGDVWKGALVLSRYLAAHRNLVAGRRVCELGAGAGFLSMSAHLLGSSYCIATDTFPKLAAANISENEDLLRQANGELACGTCDWFEVERTRVLPPALAACGAFDLILASDTLYFDAKYATALAVVAKLLLTHSGTHTHVPTMLLCQSYRGAPDVEARFFACSAREGVRSILVSQDADSPDADALAQMNIAIWRLWIETGDNLLDLERRSDGRSEWVFREVGDTPTVAETGHSAAEAVAGPHADPITAAPPPADSRATRAGDGDQSIGDGDQSIGDWPIASRVHPALGRHVIATRSLAAGELVFTDLPAAQTVHDAFVECVCHTCFAPVDGAGPSATTRTRTRRAHGRCQKCNGVQFCSDPACAEALADAHASECELLQDVGVAGTSNLRLFVRLCHLARSAPTRFGKIETMDEHYDDCTDARRQKLDAQAEGINRMLPRSVRMDTSRVARLIDRVHTNAFAIVSGPDGAAAGTGLYVRAGSLFNHSCAPSAAVSFLGRTLRIHVTRALAAGEQVTISYVDLYQGLEARRAALLAKKGFRCVCERCVSNPIEDAPLGGWRCTRQADGACKGCVPAGGTRCTDCGAEHALAVVAREAAEERWAAVVEAWSAVLVGGNYSGSLQEAAWDLLPSLDTFLDESAPSLCETHALRHRVKVLRSFAIACLPDAPIEVLVESLEDCLTDMRRHLAPSQPYLLFFQYRLAGALARQAAASRAAGSPSRAAALLRQAAEAGEAATRGLRIAYGEDHPLVDEWRRGLSSCAPAHSGSVCT